MRAAPPVAVRCTAAPAWRCVQTALPALAAGVVVFWGLGWTDDGASALRAGLSLFASLVAAVLAWRRTAQAPAWLDWDGRQWTLDGRAGSLQLMIDLGAAVLLRHGGKRWLVATRGEAATAWHGLRTALHSRSLQAPPGDGLPNA